MEKGLEEFVEFMKEELQIGNVDVRGYSPLTLAYIGDGVYDVIIRTKIVTKANMPVNKLHKMVSKLVCAKTQAEMAGSLLEIFTEEEMDVYKRGKNAKSNTPAKNANLGDYKRATGFEAVIGYLYLKKDFTRIVQVISKGLHNIEGLNDL